MFAAVICTVCVFKIGFVGTEYYNASEDEPRKVKDVEENPGHVHSSFGSVLFVGLRGRATTSHHQDSARDH